MSTRWKEIVCVLQYTMPRQYMMIKTSPLSIWSFIRLCILLVFVPPLSLSLSRARSFSNFLFLSKLIIFFKVGCDTPKWVES